MGIKYWDFLGNINGQIIFYQISVYSITFIHFAISVILHYKHSMMNIFVHNFFLLYFEIFLWDRFLEMELWTF